MKFIEINQYNEVNCFIYHPSYYVVGGLIYNISTGKLEFETTLSINYIEPFGDYAFIVKDLIGSSQIINIRTGIVENSFKIRSSKYPYLNIYKYGPSKQNGIYDFSSTNFLFLTNDWIGRDIIENHIFSCLNKHIFCRNISNEIPIWDFPLITIGQWNDQEGKAHDYEVQQFVGVFNNLLWIFLKRGLFIALDIYTGTLKYKFDGVYVTNKEGEVDEYLGEKDIYQFFFRTKYILDQDKGSIIGFNADRYYEIDLTMENPIPRLYGMWDQFQKLGVGKHDIGYTPVLRNDKLYFLMIEQGRFGVIDTISKKIVYVSDPININPENGRWAELKEIQVAEDKVYILASDNVLHIFQKEE